MSEMSRWAALVVAASLWCACSPGGGRGGPVYYPITDTTADGGADGNATPDVDAAACVPSCAGKECGDDGCGGSCGSCPAAAPFCQASLCVASCTADCAGKECGDDGCGGSCGTCPAVAPVCGADFQCQLACTPDCAGKTCGDDGCSGSCGACAGGQVCAAGSCQTPTSVCEPNPCVDPPEPTCSGNARVLYASPGACVDLGGVADCSYNVTTSSPCDGTCSGGECVDSTPGLGPHASWVSRLAFAGVDGEAECCFDLDGDGTIDNGLGDLLGSIGPVIGDVSLNDELASAVESGDLVALIEYDGLTTSSIGAVNVLDGVDNGQSYDVNVGGNEAWQVAPSSYVPGTSTPVSTLGPGTLSGGQLAAGPGQVVLSLPLILGAVPVELQDVSLEASVSVGTNGAGLEFFDGQLGGVVPLPALWDGINAYVEQECGCLNLGGPLLSYSGEGVSPTCATGGSSACGSSQDTCEQLVSFCGPLTSLVTGDYDTNGNGTLDGLTVGLWVDAVSATLNGVAAP